MVRLYFLECPRRFISGLENIFSFIFTSNCHDDVMMTSTQQFSNCSWRHIYNYFFWTGKSHLGKPNMINHFLVVTTLSRWAIRALEWNLRQIRTLPVCIVDCLRAFMPHSHWAPCTAALSFWIVALPFSLVFSISLSNYILSSFFRTFFFVLKVCCDAASNARLPLPDLGWGSDPQRVSDSALGLTMHTHTHHCIGSFFSCPLSFYVSFPFVSCLGSFV